MTDVAAYITNNAYDAILVRQGEGTDAVTLVFELGGTDARAALADFEGATPNFPDWSVPRNDTVGGHPDFATFGDVLAVHDGGALRIVDADRYAERKAFVTR